MVFGKKSRSQLEEERRMLQSQIRAQKMKTRARLEVVGIEKDIVAKRQTLFDGLGPSKKGSCFILVGLGVVAGCGCWHHIL